MTTCHSDRLVVNGGLDEGGVLFGFSVAWLICDIAGEIRIAPLASPSVSYPSSDSYPDCLNICGGKSSNLNWGGGMAISSGDSARDDPRSLQLKVDLRDGPSSADESRNEEDELLDLSKTDF